MRKTIGILTLVAAGLGICAQPALAAPPSGHHPSFHFNHHNFREFTPVEHGTWVGGRWDHGWHNGRYGWWWFAGGVWYFYDTPLYPYPDYVSDYYIDDEQGWNGGGGYWYYCANPSGYYPYVRTCNLPWEPVPAVPPGGPSGGPGAAPYEPPPADQGSSGQGPNAPPPSGYDQYPAAPPPPEGAPPPNGAPPPPNNPGYPPPSGNGPY